VRALVTGASGFVGRHLVAALHHAGAEVLACGGPDDMSSFPLDLSDVDNIRAAFDLARPDVVFHLAAQTFVPDSLDSPSATYEVNVLGTARLLAALRGYRTAENVNPRVLFTSSAEVYGVREPEQYPLRETLAPAPANPYAASKAAAEAVLLGEARSFDLDVVIARAFNHIGPGQSDRFAVPNFARQLAEIAAGARPRMQVGNLDSQRDFLDVRDVVAAYVALAREAEGGETYNVCSGTAISMKSILGSLIRVAGVPVEVHEDSDRLRPADVRISYGSNEKLRERTGWQPRVPLNQSLRDVYDDARARASNPSRP
jgi:GDP-4-dehydro-6-deoxy-D-mannose reductase